MSESFIQFGCGLAAPESWENFDASPRLWFERLPGARHLVKLTTGKPPLFPPNVRFGDITRRLPVRDGSAEGVYCSHILEHLSSRDVDRALQETFRILKPGGVFRIVVPDLYWRAATYLREAQAANESAADQFMESSMLGQESRDTSLLAIVKAAFGNSEHRWMFDFASLAHRLKSAGFVDVRRCEFGDAEHPAFKKVESLDRFFDGENRELAAEAKRPAKP